MSKQLVLLLDNNQNRRECLRESLDLNFDLNFDTYSNWEELEVAYQHGKRTARKAVAAILTYDFPATSRRKKRPFDEIKALGREQFVGLIDNVVYLARFAPVNESRNQPTRSLWVQLDDRESCSEMQFCLIRSYLQEKGVARLCGFPTLCLPEQTPLLEAIVESMDPSGSFDKGKECLKRIIRAMWGEVTVDVQAITQGMSGDLTLKISSQHPGLPSKYVLKISPPTRRDSAGRLRREVANLKLLTDTLTDHGGTISLVPRHHRPQSGDADFVVEQGHHAVAFQFVEGQASVFSDFHQLYLAPTTKDDLAEVCLQRVVEFLYKKWYSQARPTTRPLWQAGTTDKSQGYYLSIQKKNVILRWIDWHEDLYRRLLTEEPGRDLSQVREWVKGPDRQAARPVLASKIHGDLNRTNILFSSKAPHHPVLIDFADFLSDGPAFDDLAHLEAQVKFFLMDAEPRDDRPVALDHAPERISDWCLMDASLAGTHPAVPDPAGIERAARLCAWLRGKARQLGDEKQHPSWEFEYLNSLLYHTLRTIAYDGPSAMKKLLAIRSAASLIARISAFAADNRG